MNVALSVVERRPELAEVGVLHVIEIACRLRMGDQGRLVSHSVYSMSYQGELIGESESPLCDAARILLARGLVQPEDRIATARDGVISLMAGVKWASEHVAREDRRQSPSWNGWRPFPMALSRGEVVGADGDLGTGG